MDAAKGSVRQRGSGSFELRVYRGTDPVTGKRRWLTRTVRGDRSDAVRELKALAAHANIAPAVGAHTTVAALLDQWFARDRATWSPTTMRNLTSIVERHLKPGLGDILVGDLTTAIVDEFYKDLRSGGRIDGKPLAVWHGPAYPLGASGSARPGTSMVLGLRERRRPRNAAQRRTSRDAASDTGAGGTASRVRGYRSRSPSLPDSGSHDGCPWWTTPRLALDRRGPRRGSLSIQRSLVEGPEGPLL